MSRFKNPTERTLRSLAGPCGIVRLSFQKQMSVRVNAIGMRPNKKKGLPGENLSYGQSEVFIETQATVHPTHGSRRTGSMWRFLQKIRRGETPHQLIQRTLRSRARKYPITREELNIL